MWLWQLPTDLNLVNEVYLQDSIHVLHFKTDLEKAASGACRHFVGNHATLRTFWVKYPIFLTEDGGRRVEDGEMRLDQEFEVGEWERSI